MTQASSELACEISTSHRKRFPAFLLRNGVAHSGHAFREKFTEAEDRVLFGSVVR